MAVGDIYRLTIVTKSDLSPFVAVNQPHFFQSAVQEIAPTGADLIASFVDLAQEAYLNCVTEALRIVQYRVSKAPDFATEYTLDLGIGGPTGNQTGDRLVPRCASILSLRTSVLTRRGRGRLYLPPAGEASNTGGIPTATHLTALQELGDALLSMDVSVSAGNYTRWQLAVWSTLNADGSAVIACTPRSYWGSQRDRTRIFPA